MAKSLRSKRRRKMRAIKRERYGAKELERLKKTVGDDGLKKDLDVIMEEVADIVTITDIKAVKGKSERKKKTNQVETEESMDDDTIKHNYSTKTMRDQFGSYPNWMNQRKINKRKKTRKGRPKRK